MNGLLRFSQILQQGENVCSVQLYSLLLHILVIHREMCLKYAQLETKLGEVDRARAIFSHGSQMSDPRTAKSYWKTWQEFEVRHGNEDTFREMLRIKRSVQAQFNTQVHSE